MDQLAEAFQPKLGKSSVTVGLIQSKSDGTRLKLSDAIAEQLAIALKNKGAALVASEERLSKTEQANFLSGLSQAQVLITGTFQKWGNAYSVMAQAVDIGSGKVLEGKTVRIAESDIPPDLLEPVTSGDTIQGEGHASISYQCFPEEKPCPPAVELKRRAVDAARLMAMEDFAAKTGVSLSAVNQVINGRAGNKTIESQVSGQLRNVKIQEPVIQGDEVIIKMTAEIFSSPKP
ncbi:hypothetical protein WDW89_21160 [Deltaproteobacteria bacterium TL4]